MLGALFTVAGMVSVGFYLYVAAMMAYAEYMNDLPNSFGTMVVKPLMWPLTAWSSISKLYQSMPD